MRFRAMGFACGAIGPLLIAMLVFAVLLCIELRYVPLFPWYYRLCKIHAVHY